MGSKKKKKKNSHKIKNLVKKVQPQGKGDLIAMIATLAFFMGGIVWLMLSGTKTAELICNKTENFCIINKKTLVNGAETIKLNSNPNKIEDINIKCHRNSRYGSSCSIYFVSENNNEEIWSYGTRKRAEIEASTIKDILKYKQNIIKYKLY